MAAKRIAKSSINWPKFAERVPPNQKTQYLAFKAKSDSYLRRVFANPENAPKIDWALYKKHVPVAGMVDNFQKSYEALKVPYPVDNVTAKVVEQEQQMKAEITEFKKKSHMKIDELCAKLAHLNSLLPFDQMTMEDFKDSYPELALDPIKKPTFWPHDAEEQIDFRDKGHPMYGLDPHGAH